MGRRRLSRGAALMMAMSTSTLIRKSTTGERGNPGEFGTHRRPEAEATLTDEAQFPVGYNEDFLPVSDIVFEGEVLHITAGDDDDYQVRTADRVVDFWGSWSEADAGAPRTYLTRKQEETRAVQAYTASLAAEMRSRIGMVPDLDAALAAEADRLLAIAGSKKPMYTAVSQPTKTTPTLI